MYFSFRSDLLTWDIMDFWTPSEFHEIWLILNGLKIDDDARSPGPAAYLPCFPNMNRAPTVKFLFPLKHWTDNYNIPPPNAYTLRKDEYGLPLSRRKGYTMWIFSLFFTTQLHVNLQYFSMKGFIKFNINNLTDV